jgi:hypothetical protein
VQVAFAPLIDVASGQLEYAAVIREIVRPIFSAHAGRLSCCLVPVYPANKIVRLAVAGSDETIGCFEGQLRERLLSLGEVRMRAENCHFDPRVFGGCDLAATSSYVDTVLELWSNGFGNGCQLVDSRRNQGPAGSDELIRGWLRDIGRAAAQLECREIGSAFNYLAYHVRTLQEFFLANKNQRDSYLTAVEELAAAADLLYEESFAPEMCILARERDPDDSNRFPLAALISGFEGASPSSFMALFKALHTLALQYSVFWPTELALLLRFVTRHSAAMNQQGPP